MNTKREERNQKNLPSSGDVLLIMFWLC